MPGESVIILGRRALTEHHLRVIVDPLGSLDSANWLVLIDYVGTANPIYVGEAAPGTLTGVALWRIKRITWVAGNPTAVEWANGSADFIHEWDDRALYAYS